MRRRDPERRFIAPLAGSLLVTILVSIVGCQRDPQKRAQNWIDNNGGSTHETGSHVLLRGERFDSVERVADIQTLEFLNIEHTRVEELGALERLPKLKWLHVFASPIADLSVVGRLKGLTDLALVEVPADDLSPIGRLTGLTHLDLRGTAVVDWTWLSELKQLRKLTAWGLGGPAVAELRQSLPSDCEVEVKPPTGYLDPNAGRVSIPIAASLRRWLEDVGGTISDDGCSIGLSGTDIEDLLPLAEHRGLQVLNFDNTRVRDLRPLAGLLHLKLLSFEGCPVDDLSPLKMLPALRRVRANRTLVREVSVLRDHTTLAELSVDGTPVSAEAVEQLQAALPGCRIISPLPTDDG